jgi:predicted nucleic acid-binding protein
MSAKIKLLLDTNVLLDYLVAREPFCVAARKLMILGAVGEAKLWLSASQFNDVFYVLSKGGNPAQGLSTQERLRRCRSFLHIVSTTEADIDAAIQMAWPDLEDASVSVAATKIGANYIITRDQSGFAQSPVPAISPQDFFALLQSSL